MAKNKKIVMALKEIKVEKKKALVPAEVAAPSGIHYPTFNIQTKFVPPLKEAELDQKVTMMIEGKVSGIDDYKTKNEAGGDEEHSTRTIEVHRVGISKIGEALKS